MSKSLLTQSMILTVLFLVVRCPIAFSEDQTSLKIITVHSRDELIRAVRAAQPDTKILMAPGEYRGGLSFADLQGTKGKPIVLAALDAKQPPQIIGGTSGLHLIRPSFVELHSLHFGKAKGNGLNIDDGGDAKRPAKQIVLKDLQIRDIGPKGNRDGIKLSGVEHFHIENCTIERWGESGSAIDMVGCHEGEIVKCQFKYRGDIFGNGVQTKGGSADISIRRCRFENAGGRAINIGGSTGRAYFRPLSAGYEAKNISVEDCTFIGSMSPITFVGVDGATVRYNTIYRPTRWVIRILQESQGKEFVPCRNGSFTNNIIVFRSNEVRSVVNVGGGTDPQTFDFSGNHWFCIDNPQRSDRLGLPVKESKGSYGINPKFVDAAKGDLRLISPSQVRGAGVRRPQ